MSLSPGFTWSRNSRSGVSPPGPTPTQSCSFLGDTNRDAAMRRTVGTPASRSIVTWSYWFRGSTNINTLRTHVFTGGYDTDGAGDPNVYDMYRPNDNEYFADRQYGATARGYLRRGQSLTGAVWYHVYVTSNTQTGVASGFFSGAPFVVQEAYPGGFDSGWGILGNMLRLGGQQSGPAGYRGEFYDVYMLYGIAPPVSDFAQDVTGTWSAKKYTGSFPAGSYNLDFMDAADPGKDVSGNGNHFALHPNANLDTDVFTGMAMPPRVDE